MGKTKTPQNRTKAGRTPKGTFARGVSGNPGGRPQNQRSISYWLKHFGNMATPLVAKELEGMLRELKKGDAGVDFFQLVAVRTLMAMVNEPDARMLREVMDRTEGKLPTRVVTWEDDVIGAIKNGAPYRIVESELGESLARELFHRAGIDVP
jgi:hypothetical protein